MIDRAMEQPVPLPRVERSVSFWSATALLGVGTAMQLFALWYTHERNWASLLILAAGWMMWASTFVAHRRPEFAGRLAIAASVISIAGIVATLSAF